MQASSAGAGQCAAAGRRHGDGGADVVGPCARPRTARAAPGAGRARPTRALLALELRAARRACGNAAAGSSSSRAASARTAGLRQLHVPPAAGVLRHGLLRTLARLAGQPHREQQLGAVDEQLAQPAVLLADAPFGDGRVGERGRGLAAQAEHPREVGVGEPDLQRQRLVPGQPLGLAQVRLRGGELVPEGVARPALVRLVRPTRALGAGEHERPR
jgi:hypothetical protein